MMTKQEYKDSMLQGYLLCALWVTFDLEDNVDTDDIETESLKQAEQEITAFLNKVYDDVKYIAPSQVGHDFFLTRNRHGTGFWDRYLDEKDIKLKVIAKELGKKLTAIAESFGEVDVYKQDEKVYIE